MVWLLVFFNKWAIPGLFFVYFHLFHKQTIKFLQQINVKKCPSSIWCWDWNRQPWHNESHPITTRPGLVFCLSIVSFHFKVTTKSYFCPPLIVKETLFGLQNHKNIFTGFERRIAIRHRIASTSTASRTGKNIIFLPPQFNHSGSFYYVYS